MCLMRLCLGVMLLEAAVFSAGALARAAEDRLGDPLPDGAIQRLGTLRLRYGSIGDLAYLPDGWALVAAGRDLDIWDMSRGEKRQTLRIANSSIARMQVSRDGGRLLFKDGGDVVEYSFLEQRELHRFPTHQAGFNWLAYSPDETRVLTTGYDPPTLKEFTMATGEETASIRGSFAVFRGAVYGPGGNTAFVGGGYENSLAQYDLRAGQKLYQAQLGHSINDLTISPDGQRLLLGCWHDAIEVKMDGHEKLNQFRGHHGHAATAVAYCKAPNQILTGSRDGSIRRWDRLKNEVLLRWVAHSSLLHAHSRIAGRQPGAVVRRGYGSGERHLQRRAHYCLGAPQPERGGGGDDARRSARGQRLVGCHPAALGHHLRRVARGD